MNAVVKENDKGTFIDGMPNKTYHMERGLSTSKLKNFMEDPAIIKWSREAPQDEEKLAALDFGTDFHSYFLEPEVFKETYRVMPEFSRRKKDEKEAEQELIKEWKELGFIPVAADDMKKIEAMRGSAMAHPTVKAIMGMGGVAERSFFWTDPKTGLLCKCRPDHLVTDINDDNRPYFLADDVGALVTDVKTIAQMDRVQAQIENLKYYVQDQFYSRGISQVLGVKVEFVFIFVSTTLSLGRYPVKVVKLSDEARFDGRTEINESMAELSAIRAKGDDAAYQTIVELDRPHWATREQDIL